MAHLLPHLALTIKQPWASLIVSGSKDIENRLWRTHFRGLVFIHASKKKDDDEMRGYLALRASRQASWPKRSERSDSAIVTWGDAPAGGIIGMAEIVDCVDHSDSPWFVGPFGFVLQNARPLPFFACRGTLGFWKCDYPLLSPPA